MKPQLFLVFIFFIVSSSFAQAQGEIYKLKGKQKDLVTLGKCEGNQVFLLEKNKFELVGKVEDSLLYQKLQSSNKWRLVGKLNQGVIYKKHPFHDSWKRIGKFEGEEIFKKGRFSESWKPIGRYSSCPGGAAFLLLLYSKPEKDAGSVL
jgi:hypothetical protein